MSIKIINVCDRCGTECKWAAIPVTILEGSARRTEEVDLCENCSRNVLLQMVNDMQPEQAADWLRFARTKPVPRRV